MGTFSPYSAGVKANVIFFDKAGPTKAVWIYDLRTNIDNIAKKTALTTEHFKEFVELYNKRKEGLSERWKKFFIDDVKKRDFNLDIFWIKSNELDSGEYEEPEVILESIKESEEKTIEEIDSILDIIKNGNNFNSKK